MPGASTQYVCLHMHLATKGHERPVQEMTDPTETEENKR